MDIKCTGNSINNISKLRIGEYMIETEKMSL
jgi:hypothetical protein